MLETTISTGAGALSDEVQMSVNHISSELSLSLDLTKFLEQEYSSLSNKTVNIEKNIASKNDIIMGHIEQILETD